MNQRWEYSLRFKKMLIVSIAGFAVYAILAAMDQWDAANTLMGLFVTGAVLVAIVMATMHARRIAASSLPAGRLIRGRAGAFRISGVDRQSKLDATDYIQADSPENAKAKAELNGMIVTKIERA
jgi:hypothetical protein